MDTTTTHPNPSNIEESPDAPPPPPPPSSPAQVDSDLALARLMQQQERAFMALRRNQNYESSDDWSYGDEVEVAENPGSDSLLAIGEGMSVVGSEYGDDEYDAVIDAVEFEDDEAFARALMQNEARGLVAHMMALFGLLPNGPENLRNAGVNSQVSGSNSQEAWQEIDPDNYTYEELLAIGNLVGTESKGLAADTVAALPVVNYKAGNIEDGNADRCVICQLEYEEGNTLVVLLCKHSYHPECIKQWLQMNKVCPVCNTEVSTSDNIQDSSTKEVA